MTFTWLFIVILMHYTVRWVINKWFVPHVWFYHFICMFWLFHVANFDWGLVLRWNERPFYINHSILTPARIEMVFLSCKCK